MLTNVCTGVILVPWLAALAWFASLIVRAFLANWREANATERRGFEPVMSERDCAQAEVDALGQQRPAGGEEVRVKE